MLLFAAPLAVRLALAALLSGLLGLIALGVLG